MTGPRSMCPTTMRRAASALALAAAMTFPMAASAVPGTPDPAFGPGGMRLHANAMVNAGDDTYERQRVLTNGRVTVLTVQRCGIDCRRWVITKYTQTGDIDTSFGPGGSGRLAILWYDNLGMSATNVVLNANGTLLVGYSGSIVKYGVDGINVNVLPATVGQQPIAMQSDGKILLAGLGRVNRINPDGSPDASFAPISAATIPTATATSGTIWLAWPDGKAIKVVRRAISGSPTTTARIVLPQTATTRRTVARVVKIGTASNGTAAVTALFNQRVGTHTTLRATVLGLTSTATRRTSFAAGGFLFVSAATGTAMQNNGRIVLANPASGSSTGIKDLVVRRILPSGAPDRTFPLRRLASVSIGFVDGPDVGIDPVGRSVLSMGVSNGDSIGGVLIARLRAK